ncbi:putative mitochondrial protein [Andalucia godoyi]|uniref:Putative mitochondrial protein n=1 Tax=Andalucia godoyi TaxID=505711 RepID=A0A8K0AJU0_ANDGO|nr:putative mitochondrial protein [Andalucia godoyi]|eukprot:ANDGO_01543.mRNA.1 putative mitochondrial protein
MRYTGLHPRSALVMRKPSPFSTELPSLLQNATPADMACPFISMFMDAVSWCHASGSALLQMEHEQERVLRLGLERAAVDAASPVGAEILHTYTSETFGPDLIIVDSRSEEIADDSALSHAAAENSDRQEVGYEDMHGQHAAGETAGAKQNDIAHEEHEKENSVLDTSFEKSNKSTKRGRRNRSSGKWRMQKRAKQTAEFLQSLESVGALNEETVGQRARIALQPRASDFTDNIP